MAEPATDREMACFINTFKEQSEKLDQLRASVNERAERMLEAPVMVPANQYFTWDSEVLLFRCRTCLREARPHWDLIEHEAACRTGRWMKYVYQTPA